MGYTNYWTFKKIKRGDTLLVKAAYATAIADCQTLVAAYASVHGGISGYTAHTAPGKYDGVMFNGANANGCEDFVLPALYPKNGANEFCKTNMCPYDVLVKACIIILKAYLGDYVSHSSDDRTSTIVDAWLPAARLVAKMNKINLIKIGA